MEKCVMALGTFDGVHIGHRRVIGKARDIARAAHQITKVFTFSDHPKKDVPLLTDPREKSARLLEAGADDVISRPFDTVRDLSPEQFIWWMIGEFGAGHFVCGEDFRFGKDGAGDVETLRRIARACGADVTVVEFARDAAGEKISSRTIRKLVEAGECEKTFETLGAYYTLEADVIHGKGLAHKWGTPTLNQRIPSGRVRPKYGVYVTLAETDGEQNIAVTNVGVRPSFEDGDAPNMETYIIDRILGEIPRARIRFLKYLRQESRFDSEKELSMQIARDIQAAKRLWRDRRENGFGKTGKTEKQ